MMQQVVVNPESGNPVVVSRSVYRGEERLDVRQHYYTREGDLRPTKKGVSLTIADGFAAETLAVALEALSAKGEFHRALNAESSYPLVIRRTVYRGQNRVDLRRHYVDEAGELHPTQKGVSLPAGLDAEVIAAMMTVLEGGEGHVAG